MNWDQQYKQGNTGCGSQQDVNGGCSNICVPHPHNSKVVSQNRLCLCTDDTRPANVSYGNEKECICRNPSERFNDTSGYCTLKCTCNNRYCILECTCNNRYCILECTCNNRYCILEFICEGIFCEYLQVFTIAKNTTAKISMVIYVLYILYIICYILYSYFSIAKIFPVKFIGIITNIFQRKKFQSTVISCHVTRDNMAAVAYLLCSWNEELRRRRVAVQ